MNNGRATPSGDDGIDRTLRCESTDGGQTWSDVRDHGDYGMHYPRVLRRLVPLLGYKQWHRAVS